MIPTLNAASQLAATLDALAPERSQLEIIVSDGGSCDETQAVARAAGAAWVATGRGRGPQLRAGAATARGAWLLFLHADTRLAPGWRALCETFAANPANGERAAAFRFALDDADPRARRIERAVAWRCRTFGLAYGDQGLLIARAFYERLGGYPPQPLMEDVALVRRVGRRRLVLLDHPAITSAERYRRNGWRSRPARNAALLALHFLGVPSAVLSRLYEA